MPPGTQPRQHQSPGGEQARGLTVLDAGRNGHQGHQEAQAAVHPDQHLVVQAALRARVKQSHEHQGCHGDGVQRESHQGKQAIPHLLVVCTCSPVERETSILSLSSLAQNIKF